MTTNDTTLQSATTTVPCRIYRSTRKAETYLYLRQDLTETVVPAALLTLLGRLDFVMELDLYPGRSLAREDISQVLTQLANCGWYLQMPSPLPGG